MKLKHYEHRFCTHQKCGPNLTLLTPSADVFNDGSLPCLSKAPSTVVYRNPPKQISMVVHAAQHQNPLKWQYAVSILP